ncbi:hypothetical protein CEXT_349541 [Caerostris extrusa]|uniref:Uncharacterized protein n=1 Tax=Caerostris extrusa TaxID=172846 RepID=A0AAV4VAQ1_CAEEX|nr:hypothetical protein CEXT_349541 [Caerostris extrusa]
MSSSILCSGAVPPNERKRRERSYSSQNDISRWRRRATDDGLPFFHLLIRDPNLPLFIFYDVPFLQNNLGSGYEKAFCGELGRKKLCRDNYPFSSCEYEVRTYHVTLHYTYGDI